MAYRDKSQGHVFIHKKGEMIRLHPRSDITDDMAKELDVVVHAEDGVDVLDHLADILQDTEEEISEGTKSYKDMFLGLIDSIYSLINKHR